MRLSTDAGDNEVRSDPGAERLVEGSPVAFTTPQYRSDDGRVLIGLWRCTPGRWRVAYEETEYCRILSGKGALIDHEGTVLAFTTGDEFVVPAGFRGEWHVTESMAKRYVILL